MARGVQVSKMGKRKRVGTWTSKARKKARVYNPLSGISVRSADYGYPDTLRTKLRYCDTYVLSGGVGVIGNQVMSLNSPYDPDVSGLGHQPMWFDQLCGAVGTSPYGRYRVTGSTINVTFSMISQPSTSTTSVAPALVGVLTSRSSALLASNTSGLMETSNCQWKIVGDKDSGNSTIVIKNKFNPKKDLGIDPADEALSASYNASPFLGWFAHLFKVDDTGASSVRAYVEIVYDVVFFSRNEVTQS